MSGSNGWPAAYGGGVTYSNGNGVGKAVTQTVQVQGPRLPNNNLYEVWRVSTGSSLS